MNISYSYTKLKWDGYKTLISTLHSPTWFERIFLLRRSKTVCYVGRGSKWNELDKLRNLQPVSKAICERLEAIEGGVITDYKLGRNKGKTISTRH